MYVLLSTGLRIYICERKETSVLPEVWAGILELYLSVPFNLSENLTQPHSSGYDLSHNLRLQCFRELQFVQISVTHVNFSVS